jgi:hypothetical protein
MHINYHRYEVHIAPKSKIENNWFIAIYAL